MSCSPHRTRFAARHCVGLRREGLLELAAGGALAVTYASNRLSDFAGLVEETPLYHPRYVKKLPQQRPE